MTSTCSSCMFFQAPSGGRTLQGFCKRFPPTVIPLPGNMIGSAVFPIVLATEWCGEHLPGASSAGQEAEGLLPHAEN
jgi:hypothetical protein